MLIPLMLWHIITLTYMLVWSGTHTHLGLNMPLETNCQPVWANQKDQSPTGCTFILSAEQHVPHHRQLYPTHYVGLTAIVCHSTQLDATSAIGLHFTDPPEMCTPQDLDLQIAAAVCTLQGALAWAGTRGLKAPCACLPIGPPRRTDNFRRIDVVQTVQNST